MSALPPHWAEKDEITREDLLKAMEKLSHIIESDKHTDYEHNQKNYYESPGKAYHNDYRMDSENYRDINYLNEPDLIENVKAAAKDLSELVHRNDEYDRSMRRSVLGDSNDRGHHNGSEKLSTTINRLYELDSKKKERIAALQFQKYKEELGSLKNKPEISLNSKILAETRAREPIYQRSKDIIKQKEENLTRLKKHLEETRNEREPPPTFQPNLISKRSLQDDSRIRSAKEFTSQVYAWQTKRQETIQREQYENLTKELEELTFKPKINKKSLELAQKKRENEPVEIRLQKLKEEYEEKMKNKREVEKPSFKPILNEKSLMLSKHRKNNIENIWKNKNRGEDISFVNINQGSGEFPIESYDNSRSLTPGRSTNRLEKKSSSNFRGSKTPRVHEIEYTPAMDFLLKKIS